MGGTVASRDASGARKPIADTARDERLWKDMVLPLADAYEMRA